MAKMKLLFALFLFLLSAVIIVLNPNITGAVVSDTTTQPNNSLFVIGLGFLFVLTGLIVTVSAKFDVSTKYYRDNHFDFVFEDESELDKHSFLNEYDEHLTIQQAKRRRIK